MTGKDVRIYDITKINDLEVLGLYKSGIICSEDIFNDTKQIPDEVVKKAYQLLE